MADERRTRKPKAAQPEAPHPLEWVIGGISGLLIIALLGYLGYRAMSADGRPPDFAATVESVERAGDVFHVSIAVTNPGDETVAGLVVQATLDSAGEMIETGEIEFDYLPAGSTRRGAFVFKNDPARAGELRLFVLGYTDP
jgi:uncharacterized protein (TIGR02588 family)